MKSRCRSSPTRWRRAKSSAGSSIPATRSHHGEALAEVETDKADMVLEAFDDGVLREIKLEEGESAPVGAVIAAAAQSPRAPRQPRIRRCASQSKPAPSPEPQPQSTAQSSHAMRAPTATQDRDAAEERERNAQGTRRRSRPRALPTASGARLPHVHPAMTRAIHSAAPTACRVAAAAPGPPSRRKRRVHRLPRRRPADATAHKLQRFAAGATRRRGGRHRSRARARHRPRRPRHQARHR